MKQLIWRAVAAALCLYPVACGGEDPVKEDPCATSICGPSSTGSGTTGPGSGGASSTTGGGTVSGSGGATGSGSGGASVIGTGAGGASVVTGTGGASMGGAGTGSVPPFDAGGIPMGTPADLDMNFYKCNVEPIFDRGCAMMGCHGAEAGRPLRLYARGRLRNTAEMVDNQSCLQKTAPFVSGTIMCTGWHPHSATEWQRNFDSARQFMTKNLQPDQSQLLTQATKGGLPHAGVHLFVKDDASYTMVKRWLSGEKLAACDPNPN